MFDFHVCVEIIACLNNTLELDGIGCMVEIVMLFIKMEIFPPKQRGPFLRPSPTILSAHLLNLSPTSYFLKTGEETAAQSGHNVHPPK